MSDQPPALTPDQRSVAAAYASDVAHAVDGIAAYLERVAADIRRVAAETRHREPINLYDLAPCYADTASRVAKHLSTMSGNVPLDHLIRVASDADRAALGYGKGSL